MTDHARHCTVHPESAAIAVCCGCGGDICAQCHNIDTRGFALCEQCRRDRSPPTIPWEAGSFRLSATGFIRTALAVLTSPQVFFRRFRFRQSWTFPAIFGVICVTLGMLINTLWQKAFSADYADTIATYQDQLGVSQPAAELAIFAMLPLGAVVVYFVHTALFYLAAGAFGIDDADWTTIARITGYSLAAYLMLVFPPIGQFNLGHFLMVLWLFNLEVAAVRDWFGLGFWKSIGLVLLPFVVFLFAIG